MWRTILEGVGLSFIAYKLYRYKYLESSIISSILGIPLFLTSRDLQLNDYICEIGHIGSLGSCLRLRDINNTELVFSKLIKTIDTIDKDGSVSYHFDGDITLTFLKNEEKNENQQDNIDNIDNIKNIICKFERNGEVIEGNVTGFVKNYKPILFNSDFDLICKLN